MRFSLPMVLGLLLSATIHVYLWQRLVRRTHLPRPWSRLATGLLIVLFCATFFTPAARLFAPRLATTMGWVTLPWMALGGLTCLGLLAFDLVAGLRWSARRTRGPVVPESPSRREFLSRVTGGAAMAVASTSVGHGMLVARGEHEVVDVEVHLAKLPKALDGFTIIQLSDLHVGLTIDREFVARVVAQTMAHAPDLIVLTGDLVDGPVPDLTDDVAPLAELRAPHGVFATTGNHEYYAGVDPWIAHISTLGVRYLRNQRVTIERAGARFELAGVDDFGAHNWEGHGEDLYAATAGRDPSVPLILLAHQPRQVFNAAKRGVDLQLSGHTHGGQIWPWHYIVKVQQSGLLAGRYQIADTQLYVTRGCGYWGPPVRVLAPLELTRVILRSA